MHETDLKSLLSYLKENASLYPLEALRERMVRAGHAPAEADLAIAVFEGKVPPPEPPVWPAVLLVALLDFVLAGACAALFSRRGAGEASCSALVLVPAIYLAELFAGLAFLASGRDRRGRVLLLGLLLFFALGALVLLVVLARWLGKVAG
ncbi:MAG TPA: hypothetical protein VHC97_27120 [Thermoanaerobaculia bacterium]|jgi:hypothetical protein|nr:hypothetical protein [Thermoanaerobaculia bacterium]